MFSILLKQLETHFLDNLGFVSGVQKVGVTQGRRIQNWLGGLAPGFPNYWGGKIAPQISNIGGQDFENPNISSA